MNTPPRLWWQLPAEFEIRKDGKTYARCDDDAHLAPRSVLREMAKAGYRLFRRKKGAKK